MQDLQIIFGTASLVVALAEPVVGDAKARGREQIVAVSVIRERARLADQRIDDVPIVDRVLVATHQPRQRIDVFVRVPDLDAVGEQACFDLFADQAAMHRVRVAVNVNQTAGVHTARNLQTRRHALIGQVPQREHFLGETVFAAHVPRRHDLAQEVPILLAAGEIATAAE